MITAHNARSVENEVKVTKGKLTHVSSVVAPANPKGKITSVVFARKDFEDALNKVSRPAKTTD